MLSRLLLVQYLITAVGVAACRHGHVYKLLNLTSGEKHIYAIYVLQAILAAGIAVFLWFYDINCRYGLRAHGHWVNLAGPVVQAMFMRYASGTVSKDSNHLCDLLFCVARHLLPIGVSSSRVLFVFVEV